MAASKNVLVTGASGLLGRAIYKCFSQDAQWCVTGLAFSRYMKIVYDVVTREAICVFTQY